MQTGPHPKAAPLGPTHQREPGYPSPRATSTRGRSQTPVRAPRATPNKRGTCNFCGLQSHGEQERTAYRRVHCPAYGTTCTSCGRQNHTAQVCWHSDIEHESAIFEQVDTMHARGNPQPPDMEPTHQMLDEEVSTHATPPRSHHRSPQGRLQATWPHTQTGDPSPHCGCHGRHWVPELPGRTTAPGHVTPHRSRPLPCEFHHALSQWRRPTDPGSRHH